MASQWASGRCLAAGEACQWFSPPCAARHACGHSGIALSLVTNPAARFASAISGQLASSSRVLVTFASSAWRVHLRLAWGRAPDAPWATRSPASFACAVLAALAMRTWRSKPSSADLGRSLVCRPSMV